MNYTILLHTVYQAILDAPIQEKPYWENMANNLKELEGKNRIKFDVGDEQMNDFYELALYHNITELEFQMMLPRYRFYLSKGYKSEDAYWCASMDISDKK